MAATVLTPADDVQSQMLVNANQHLSSKQTRAHNWLPREEELLLEVMESYIDILDSKQTNNNVVRRQKQKAWMGLVDEFNAKSTEKDRSIHEVQKKWKNLKARSRQDGITDRKNIAVKSDGRKKPDVGGSAEGLIAHKVRQLLRGRGGHLITDAPETDTRVPLHIKREEVDTNADKDADMSAVLAEFSAVPVSRDQTEHYQRYVLELSPESLADDALLVTDIRTIESVTDTSTSVPSEQSRSSTPAGGSTTGNFTFSTNQAFASPTSERLTQFLPPSGGQSQHYTGMPPVKKPKTNRMYKEELCDSKIKTHDIIAAIETKKFEASESRLKELHRYDVELRKKQQHKLDLEIEKERLEILVLQAKLQASKRYVT